MTRVKNINNRKMTREEQIPIIKQFEAHSLLMMSSLDVAMTKIRELEEENMELKISVKEAETKISLLEREKRRANRRTVIIADSHRKALDFDRLNVRMGVNCTFVVRGWHPSTRVAIFLMTTNVDHVPPNWEMNAGWKNNLRRSCQS